MDFICQCNELVHYFTLIMIGKKVHTTSANTRKNLPLSLRSLTQRFPREGGQGARPVIHAEADKNWRQRDS
jgi:hypothetical protein